MKEETRTEEITVAQLMDDLEKLVNNKIVALNTKVRISLEDVSIPIEAIGTSSNSVTGELFLAFYPSEFFIKLNKFCEENIIEESNFEETILNFFKSLQGGE